MTPAPGYSGTPLARKLGIVAGGHVHAAGAPDDYLHWLAPLPDGVAWLDRADARADLVHVFHTRADALHADLVRLRAALREDAMLWVSWPKKSARVATDITEDTIRALALPLGFVDTKVCAVSEVWSGLKLVVRKELRGSRRPQAPGRR